MVDAVETRPGTDPGRASFTTAMEAARDHQASATERRLARQLTGPGWRKPA